jgi:putative hemolysin
LTATNWTEAIIATIALLVVALSAWVEISLAAVSRVDIRRLLDQRLSREDALTIERTQRLRSAMLLIEVLAAGVAVAMIAAIFRDIIDTNDLLWGLLVALGLLVVFGRLLPRAFASEDQEGEAGAPFRVARVLSVLFAPVIRPVEALSALLARERRRRADLEPAPAAEAEVPQNGVHSGEHERAEPHTIEEDEQEMITGILHLDQATARQIMVPRIDIVAVSHDALVSEAVDVAIQAGHSRIPVYGRNMDEILGVVYAKDLLRYVNEPHEGMTVEPLIRPAYFVPESKRVDDLLGELQQTKVHLAVVVDEYGGTAGVVTIEDILEEIVGEIQDEYDREVPQFEVISEDEAIVDGRLSVRDLVDDLELEWPGPASGTVGGFIQRQLGRIPSEEEVVQVDGLRLTVLKVEHRRVRQVRVERVHPDDAAPPTSEPETDEEAVISGMP